MDSISDHEIFLTEHKDFAYIDTLDGSCKVLTFNEYNNVIFFVDKISIIFIFNK